MNRSELKFDLSTIQPVYYKHKYGGIYCYLMDAANKDNNAEEVIVYQHIYPFPKANLVRKKVDFLNNSREITEEQLDTELHKNRVEFQEQITENKENKLSVFD